MPRFVFLLLFALLLAAPGPAAAQGSDGFGPATFYGLPAPALRGPDGAAGLVIWNHGSGSYAYIDQAPPLAWYFAMQGWDVYRQYRGHTGDNSWHAEAMVTRAVAQARALGYRRIVLMGFSMGGYAAVEVAQRSPAGVTGVIALAPATFGHSGYGWELNDHGMRPMWQALGATPLRLVAVYFPQDIFYETEMPGVRGSWLRKQLRTAAAPHLVIDQPSLPGVMGHGAGLGWSFARRYGPCIHRMIEAGSTPDCATLQRDGDATFATVRADADALQRLQAYQGRWNTTKSGRRTNQYQIGIDDLGMPLLTVTYPEQGTVDWPLNATADGGFRSETATGLLDLRRDDSGLLVSLTRPGDAGNNLQVRLTRDQLLSESGLKSSATPLMQ